MGQTSSSSSSSASASTSVSTSTTAAALEKRKPTERELFEESLPQTMYVEADDENLTITTYSKQKWYTKLSFANDAVKKWWKTIPSKTITPVKILSITGGSIGSAYVKIDFPNKWESPKLIGRKFGYLGFLTNADQEICEYKVLFERKEDEEAWHRIPNKTLLQLNVLQEIKNLQSNGFTGGKEIRITNICIQPKPKRWHEMTKAERDNMSKPLFKLCEAKQIPIFEVRCLLRENMHMVLSQDISGKFAWEYVVDPRYKELRCILEFLTTYAVYDIECEGEFEWAAQWRQMYLSRISKNKSTITEHPTERGDLLHNIVNTLFDRLSL